MSSYIMIFDALTCGNIPNSVCRWDKNFPPSDRLKVLESIRFLSVEYLASRYALADLGVGSGPSSKPPFLVVFFGSRTSVQA